MSISSLSTTALSSGVTPAEIARIALSQEGISWTADGCALFALGVTNLAGLPFFDLGDHTVNGDPRRMSDDALVVPHRSGISSGPNMPGDGWATVLSSKSVTELKATLQAGDVVRVYKAGNTSEATEVKGAFAAHSFVVVSTDGGKILVADNWGGTHIVIHSFDDIVSSFASGGAFQSAYVSRIDADWVSQNVPNTIKGAGVGNFSFASSGAETWSGGSGTDVHAGTLGNDSLSGKDGEDWLSGVAGNDTLNGGAGYDHLDGGAGDDRLIGSGSGDDYEIGKGNDTIDDQGGGGVDMIHWYGGGQTTSRDQITFSREGNDMRVIAHDSHGAEIRAITIVGQGGGAGQIETLHLLNAEEDRLHPLAVIDLAAEWARLTQPATPSVPGTPSTPSTPTSPVTSPTPGAGAPSVSNDNLAGGQGSDTIAALSGDDTVLGGAGDDYLRGDDGNDSMAGGAGFDDMNGNMGDDTLSGGDSGDWVVGGKGNDSLSGDAGDDLVYGNLGNDTGAGGAGNDLIRGGQGDDSLSGGSGNDWISGDLGNDTMSGGAGADTFHFFRGAGVDRVLDFNYAEGDRLQFDPGQGAGVNQVGGDLHVDMGGGDVMIIVGVNLSSLPSDWAFN